MAADSACQGPRQAPSPRRLAVQVHCDRQRSLTRPIPPRPAEQNVGHLQALMRSSFGLLTGLSRLIGLRGLLLHFSDTRCEALQFSAVEDFGVDHADKQGFNRSLAEPVHDTLDGAACHLLPRLRWSIDERAVFARVGKVTLLFESTQD